MNKPITDLPHPKMLLDPYAAWAAKEGVPITEDFGVNLLAVPTAPWPRFGIEGGLVHLKGRGDFVSIFVLDLAPGAKSAPQKHLFEEVVYVLSGHGNTTVEASDGRKHSFEWGPKSLFALPLNARYQHFNSSGRERARLASTNNLALMLNLFHNESFVFDNGYDFPERQGAAKYFSGEGEFIPVRPGRNMWETNFIADLAGFELKAWEQRGAGGSNMMFILADGTMHAHTSQMPVGTYKKAHRHGPGRVIVIPAGEGYSILWEEGKEKIVAPWREGSMFVPPEKWFHQHFNLGEVPARYLALHPIKQFYGHAEKVEDRARDQIEYVAEDPFIRDKFESELARRGLQSAMPSEAYTNPDYQWAYRS